jgi:hypothetical protein
MAQFSNVLPFGLDVPDGPGVPDVPDDLDTLNADVPPNSPDSPDSSDAENSGDETPELVSSHQHGADCDCLDNPENPHYSAPRAAAFRQLEDDYRRQYAESHPAPRTTEPARRPPGDP